VDGAGGEPYPGCRDASWERDRARETDLVSDDEFIEIETRPAAEVARRAIILSAVCRRAFLELSDAGEGVAPPLTGHVGGDPDDGGGRAGDDDDGAGDVGEGFDLLAWLLDEGLSDDLTPDEVSLLRAPLGALDRDEAEGLTWTVEALTGLVWALGLLPAPPAFDRPTDGEALLSVLPEPESPTGTFCREARLRDETEIAAARDEAEIWDWRAGLQPELRHPDRARQRDAREALADVVAEARDSGLLPPLPATDLLVSGEPYATVDDDALVTLAAIASHRLHALNWVCGFGETWDTVPDEV